MKLVNPTVEICPIGQNPMAKIELLGKVCTKKENNITDSSAETFFRNRIKTGHSAIASHGHLYISLSANIRLAQSLRVFYPQGKIDSYVHVDEEFIAISYRHLIDYLHFIEMNRLTLLDIHSNYISYAETCNICLSDGIYADDFISIAFYMNILLKGSKILEILNDEYLYHLHSVASLIVERYDEDIYTEHPTFYTEDDILQICPDILHVSIKFTTDRGISHEIVRHVSAAFLQESTRWCTYGGMTFVRPHWMSDDDFDIIQQGIHTSDDGTNSILLPDYYKQISPAAKVFVNSCRQSEQSYNSMLRINNKAQDARGAANTWLKTEIWVTASIQKWLESNFQLSEEYFIKEIKGIIPQRIHKSAHPDIIPIMNRAQELIDNLLLQGW